MCVANAAGQVTTALTVRTTSTEAAEEAAIALAITTGKDAITILTDSQAACRSYQRGRISKTALQILKNTAHIPETRLIWIPGHESLEGNEAAHAAARALIHRAITIEGQTPLAAPKTEPLVRYADILIYYRQGRRTFPTPHSQLTRAEATTLRRLQTNTYPHRTLLHAIYPTQYPSTCNFCPTPGTLYHQIWECQKTPGLAPITSPSYKQWVNRLTSPDLGIQRELVKRAWTASRAQGIPE